MAKQTRLDEVIDDAMDEAAPIDRDPPEPGNGLARAENGSASAALATQAARAPSPIPITGGRLMPRHSDDLSRTAMLLVKAGLVPKGAKSQEQVIVALAAGMEAGLSVIQASKNVMVVNGTPSIWGDGLLALTMASGDVEDIRVEWSGENDNLTCTVTIKRRGIASSQSGKFNVSMAKRARLWGKTGPWTDYPERMLELRARAFALRNAFPDKLMGLGIAEEIEDANTADSDRRTSDLNTRIETLAPAGT